MAAAALGANGVVVRTIRFVAGDTSGRSIPVFVLRFVATLALEAVVLAEKRKVSILVPERIFVQRDDICVATFVIGVAVGALPPFGVSIAAMKALAR
jgi:hypothetical protein